MRLFSRCDEAMLGACVLATTIAKEVIGFGSASLSGVNESYWDYVAYSDQSLPVPEPSSILALAGGIAWLGGLALRRRKRQQPVSESET